MKTRVFKNRHENARKRWLSAKIAFLRFLNTDRCRCSNINAARKNSGRAWSGDSLARFDFLKPIDRSDTWYPEARPPLLSPKHRAAIFLLHYWRIPPPPLPRIADEIADNAGSASRLIIKEHEIIPRRSRQDLDTVCCPKSPKIYNGELYETLSRHLELNYNKLSRFTRNTMHAQPVINAIRYKIIFDVICRVQ